MAIIYSYPFKQAALADTVVITDNEAVNSKQQTKKTSISSIKEIIDVVDKITDINGNNGQTGDIKLAGSNTIDIDFNAGTNSITFDTKTVPTGTGTAGLIPVWLDSNTLTDSVYSFPTTVGTEGQVLALPTPIGNAPYQLVWADNAGGGAFSGNAASGSPVAAAAVPLASGAIV